MEKFEIRKLEDGGYLCQYNLCPPITVCINFTFYDEDIFYYTFGREIRHITFVEGKMNNPRYYLDFVERHYQQEIEQTFHVILKYLKKDRNYRLKLLPLLDDETRKLWNMEK